MVTSSESPTLVIVKPYFSLSSLPSSLPTKDVVLSKSAPASRLVFSWDATVSAPVSTVAHVEAIGTGMSELDVLDSKVLSEAVPPTTAPKTFSIKGI